MPLRILCVCDERVNRNMFFFCQPDMTGLFDRICERTDDILMCEFELSVLVDPAVKVLAEGKTGDGDVVAVYEVVLHQEMQDFWLMVIERCVGVGDREETLLGIPPIL